MLLHFIKNTCSEVMVCLTSPDSSIFVKKFPPKSQSWFRRASNCHTNRENTTAQENTMCFKRAKPFLYFNICKLIEHDLKSVKIIKQVYVKNLCFCRCLAFMVFY